MNTVWLNTEERPKIEVIKTILGYLNEDKDTSIEYGSLKIRPIIKSSKFQFEYKVEGANTQIMINIVGGKSSFIDHLIFHQKLKPVNTDNPIYVIEETKTTPAESRNVNVYQRLSKFIFVDFFDNLKESKKIMLYNIRTEYSTISPTFIFGIRAMKTLGIEILGYDDIGGAEYTKFKDLEDMIQSKNKISTKREDNVPIKIEMSNKSNVVFISGKLEKSGNLGHDPNVGALTALSKLAIMLEPHVTEVVIQKHGLTQKMVTGKKNKFIKIANKIGIKLDGLTMSNAEIDDVYWQYSKTGEKIASILFHLMLLYNGIKVIYENHASCEQGYFKNPDDSLISFKKERGIPDLIFIYDKIIYLIEAEKSINTFEAKKGISQLDTFQKVEKEHCSKYHYTCEKRVICYGDEITQQKLDSHEEILFQLKTDGFIMFSKYCPQWIIDNFNNLDFDKE